MAGENKKKKPLVYPSHLRGPLARGSGPEKIISGIKFSIFQRDGALNPANHELDIYLYMPTTVKNPTEVQWDNKAIGISKSSIISAIESSGGAEGFWSKLSKGSGTLVDNLLGSSGEIGEAALRGVAGELGQIATGSITNPYLKMLFRGLGMRRFEYQFKFTPKNESEAQDIDDIIKEFRMAALPDYAGNNAISLTYPKEIEIAYLQSNYDTKDISNPWLNKFKRSVITGIEVDHATTGYYTPMRNGFPAETAISLQFTEMEIVTRGDVDRGF